MSYYEWRTYVPVAERRRKAEKKLAKLKKKGQSVDPVRIEVETALRRDIPIIPVLVGGSNMPKPAELPDSLKDFAFRNAARIDASSTKNLNGTIGESALREVRRALHEDDDRIGLGVFFNEATTILPSLTGKELPGSLSVCRWCFSPLYS